VVAEAAEVATTTEGRVVPTLASAETEAKRLKLLEQNPELAQEFRRAAFWLNQTSTLLDLINVLGRFEKSAEFRTRTEFSTVESERAEDDRQAETLKRHEMALRMGCSERVAFYQLAPSLPFTNAKLAESVGLTVEDFEGLPVEKSTCNLVYDALAESNSGLIPYDTVDARRAKLTNADDGSFNEVAFNLGLYKSRGLICTSWFLFGKGNFIWVLLAVKFAHDWRPDLIPSPVDMGLFKIGTFI